MALSRWLCRSIERTPDSLVQVDAREIILVFYPFHSTPLFHHTGRLATLQQSGNSFRLPHPETERSCYVGWLVSLIQHITSAERTAVGLPQRHQGAGEESENGL